MHVMKSKASAARQSVERYRQRMRKAGLRLVQLWVPDTRAPGFAQECVRQSRRASANRRLETEVTDWIERAQDTEGWTS